jgi:hypothetical protein
MNRRIAFLLCLFVLCWRTARRFKFAYLWAEDGAMFLFEALRDGISALTHSYAGYFHTVPRLITAAGTQLPLTWFAFFVIASCVVIHAGVVSTVAGPAYEWIALSKPLRVLLSLCLCLVAGMYEVTGNLCNLHSILFLYLGLVAYQDLRRPLAWTTVAAAWLAAGSEGGAVLFLPLFLCRAWLKARSFPEARPGRDAAVAAGIVVWTGAVVLLAWWPAHGSLVQQPRDPAYLWVIFRNWPATMMSRLVLQPLLGDHGAASMYRHDRFRAVAFGVPLAALLVYRLLRVREPSRVLLLLVPLCASVMCPLIWFVRDGALPYFDGFRLSFEGVRYTFVLAPFGLISWFAALHHQWRRDLPSTAAVYLVVFICFAMYRFKMGPLGPERDWRTAGSLLENTRRTGHPSEVTIPLNPEGWTLTYRARPP